jgi:D-alanyl-D-alanine carboxypeptidase
MKNTVFRNASGLPNSRQFTTAADIARLAQALLRDFPEYYHYFSVQRFR